MPLSAAEKIKAIQDNAEREIAAIRQEAASDIAKKLAEAREVVQRLEEEYEAITGKPVRETPLASNPPEFAGRARRLTPQEVAGLTAKITSIIKGCKTGVGLKEIRIHLQRDGVEAVKSQIVKSLKSIEGLTSSGHKASTVYFIK